MTSTRFLILLVVVMLTLSGAVGAACDRPLLFGIGATWQEWVGRDPIVWDPPMMDRIRDAGATNTRMGIDWCNIEPSPGFYVYDDYDRRVDMAVDRGLEIIGLFCTSPGWSNASGVDNIYPPLEIFADEFSASVTEIVNHFKDRIHKWEFWNEPDVGGWLPSANSYEYTKWMKRFYAAAKAADPTCQVALGSILGRNMWFINDFYKYGGQAYFDAVCVHPYPVGYQGHPYIDDQHIRDVHDAMVVYGDGHKPMWLTELGYDLNSGISESTQAAYVQQYLNLLSQSQYDYVTECNFHIISDFDPTGGLKYGLCDINLNRRQAYWTFANYAKPSTPVLSDVCVTYTSDSEAQIRWNTDIPATSQVDYGPTTAYGSTSPLDGTLVTAHQVTLTGFAADTAYHFRVRSGAAGYPTSVGWDHTFSTLPTLSTSVVNPGFEDGFDEGRADGWYCVGSGWWRDGAELSVVHSGAHSQAVGTSWGYLHETLRQHVRVTPGAEYEFSCWTRVDTTRSSGSNTKRAIGIDPTGGTYPFGPDVVWSSDAWNEETWQKQTVRAVAQKNTITLFVRADTALDRTAEWTWLYVDDASVVNVVPPACGSISGVVTDSGGGPISGAVVSTSPGGLQTTTLSDGTYTLADVPVGTYSVTASKSGYSPSTKPNIQVLENQTATADFTLSQVVGGTIRGSVKNTLGQGIPWAEVRTTSGGWATITDASGDYILADVPPGTYTLEASKPGFNTQTLSGVAVTSGSTVWKHFTLTSGFSGLDNGDFEGGFYNDPDIDHQVGTYWHYFSVSGISKCGGQYNEYRSSHWSQTIYEADWTAGIYQQVIGITTGADYTASVWMKATSTQTYGWVGIDPYGGTNPSSPNVQWSAQKQLSGSWQSISKQVKAQSSTITVFLKARNSSIAINYVYIDDAVLTQDSSGGSVIHGRVSDALGTGIAGASVSTNTGGYSAQTNYDGTYVIYNVSPGTYTVTAECGGFITDSRSGVVVPASGDAEVDFTLIAPSQVSILQARETSDGEVVLVEGVVSAVFGDCFYVEQPDRLAAVKVMPLLPVVEQDSVAVAGTMATVGGERVLSGAVLY